MAFSLDNPGFEMDVSDQVDIHQSDVSRTSSGSSAPSGNSTRRSCARFHGRMSSFSLDRHIYLSVEVLNVIRIQDVMNVYRGPRRRWMVILS